jgi:hypothetical protein
VSTENNHTVMSDEDQILWRSARTLDDLGELTAMWLEGQIVSRPAYCPGCGPATETLPLVPVLARANRAGLVTIQSQPALSELDSQGWLWRQRAAVEAFIAPDNPLLHRLIRTAAQHQCQLNVLPHFQEKWLNDDFPGTVVTTVWGERHSTFGLAHPSELTCKSPLATDAVADAVAVLLLDPVWDDSDRLWHWLDTQVRAVDPATVQVVRLRDNYQMSWAAIAEMVHGDINKGATVRRQYKAGRNAMDLPITGATEN